MVYISNHISKAGIDGKCVTHGNSGYWWENVKRLFGRLILRIILRTYFKLNQII
jgi:hypothetical protein